MDLQKMITDAIAEKVMGEVTQKMGISGGAAGGAISAALPMLMGALSKNADSNEGAAAIAKAAESHDGGIMGQLGDLVSNPDAGAGAGILKHMFGSDQGNVEQAIAKKAGIDVNQAGGILKVLAPLVMGKLGEAQSGGTDIAGLLQGESSSKGMLNAFLDQDGDGEIGDDLLKMGGSFLKSKFFG